MKVHIGNIEDNPYIGKLFDLIVLNQVIEHIPELHKALEIIKEKLSPNGRIIIVVPNNASSENLLDLNGLIGTFLIICIILIRQILKKCFKNTNLKLLMSKQLPQIYGQSCK